LMITGLVVVKVPESISEGLWTQDKGIRHSARAAHRRIKIFIILLGMVSSHFMNY
jgi:hypothetical protein